MLTNNTIRRSEQNILSYMNNILYIEYIIDKIDETFFSNKAYSRTFKIMKLFYINFKTTVNTDWVNNKFGNKPEVIADFSSGYSTIFEEKVKSQGDLDSNIETLIHNKQFSIMQQMQEKLGDNINDIDKMAEIIKETSTKIQSLDFNKNEKSCSLRPSDYTEQAWDAYTNPTIYQNLIQTGFDNIDTAIGGMQKGELCYIIGRKGHGKSILMSNIGYNIWKQENNVLFITLEIKKEDYAKRINSFYTNISALKFKTGVNDSKTMEQLKKGLDNLKENMDENGVKHTTYFDILETNPNTSINRLKKLIEQQQQKYGIIYDCIVLDYASLMQPNEKQREDRLKHGQIAFELKLLAKELDVLIISAAQMNRAGETSEFATSSNIANSDSIADHLDWGFEIKLDKDLTKNVGIIQSFKCRDGENFIFNFIKKYETFRIEESTWGKTVEEFNEIDWK